MQPFKILIATIALAVGAAANPVREHTFAPDAGQLFSSELAATLKLTQSCFTQYRAVTPMPGYEAKGENEGIWRHSMMQRQFTPKVSPIGAPARSILTITEIGFKDLSSHFHYVVRRISTPLEIHSIKISTPLEIHSIVLNWREIAILQTDVLIHNVRDFLRLLSWPLHYVSTFCIDHYSKDKAEYGLEAGLLHGWRKDHGTPPAKGLHGVF
ncbi:hypothetical protein C8R45DRAFT_946256 [Mycena sanguinolenta]|nr:hypothetical protein C8R45DRAFT_946256 [Mycena sanguinolenta]